ncbi:uncharacterized protein LOC112563278 [Pomacea canaliculata]|uniref:uncharacterized protein LOC112563278 n=1 Tax=Pomacea canaliculata TaxID=400727 RepID=UPI000D73F924|nr:uncharacterized protein LOC112563278 [Pomacea canaliculata]XP_025092907.1 uncharacterized protein LOC112563278 [Pomacea canaliculata]
MTRTLMTVLLVAVLLFARCHGDCNLPDGSVCARDLCHNSHLSSLICPHMCGHCIPRTQATATTTVPSTTRTTSHVTTHFSTTSFADGSCEDRLEDNLCTSIPHFCTDTYANLLCPKTCGFCCEDRVREGVTCEQLEELSKNVTSLCEDPLGSVACKKFCGFCTST